jgi:uncharacterized membrane protein
MSFEEIFEHFKFAILGTLIGALIGLAIFLVSSYSAPTGFLATLGFIGVSILVIIFSLFIGLVIGLIIDAIVYFKEENNTSL